MHTNLLLGLHSHQPIDNFDSVVYEAIAKSYRPFFETVQDDDWLRFSLHISGWLFDFIKRNDPSLFAMIKKCSDKGMIEFFSGGYYEPVLAAIPQKDRVLQIQKLNTFLYDNFGAKPRGLWLTERVWSESIVDSLVDCGIEYIITDDYHFIAAGFDERVLKGYYMTEEGGNKLGIFPISRALRYLVPFKKASTVIAELEKPEYKEKAAIIFDDGEKFGLWPKTYEWVYEKGWLREFLDLLKESEEIKTSTYSDYFDSNKPLGVAYLPEVSYYEMGEWSLGADDSSALENVKHHVASSFGESQADKFVKGGIWKNFLTKYPESNEIHKKTVRLSKEAAKKGDPLLTETVLKSEANDALWHGVFGGIYLPNLRDNCYRYIIEAEKILGLKEGIYLADDNLDGYEEARAVGKDFYAVFDSKYGGQMSEFSSFATFFNYQNTLTRRKESYHAKFFAAPESKNNAALSHEDGIDTIHDISIEATEQLRENLFYDWYKKNSFIDHITDGSFCVDSLFRNDFREYGDFANQPFSVTLEDGEAVFSRDGGIYTEKKIDANITKRFSVSDEGIDFCIECLAVEGAFVFAEEFNLHFADYENLLINGELYSIQNLVLENIWNLEIEDKTLGQKISFNINKPMSVAICPVNTASQNEQGAELCTQGVSIAFYKPFEREFNICGRLFIGGL